jgi:anti-sigma factor RsiW
MTRHELELQLPDYADGQVSADVRVRIAAELPHRPEWCDQVQRWQALRRSAQRVLERTPIPVGLADRVQATLSPVPVRVPVRSPFFRFGLPGLAAAAAVTLGFAFWPRGAAATVIDASNFAAVHRRCALGGRHDSFQVRGHELSEVCEEIRRAAGFGCHMPSHAPSGYVLDGGCACWPGSAMHVVHVYFRAVQPPERIVSLFALDRVVQVRAPGAAGRDCGGGQRQYRRAADGDVTLIVWGDGQASYVLAGRMPEPELVGVADGLGLGLAPVVTTRASGPLPQFARQP